MLLCVHASNAPEGGEAVPQSIERVRSRRLRGFSLIEMLFVVTLIGILVGLSVPRFPVAAMRADAGVRTLRATLQRAQRSAVTRQMDVVVGVDAAGSRLVVHEDVNRDGAVDAGEPMRSVPLAETAQLAAPPRDGIFGAVSHGVVGTNLRTRHNLQTVTFRRDGTASSDLELYVTASGGREQGWRAVVVASSTGRVEGWRLVGSNWARMRP